mmetsp:Transcript_31215/g.90134  ORF Transcript_31215/g.90134 Transcript_31215/m.90134 type:complete len:541 (+) Transcript_31215:1671-3293(+)
MNSACSNAVRVSSSSAREASARSPANSSSCSLARSCAAKAAFKRRKGRRRCWMSASLLLAMANSPKVAFCGPPGNICDDSRRTSASKRPRASATATSAASTATWAASTCRCARWAPRSSILDVHQSASPMLSTRASTATSALSKASRATRSEPSSTPLVDSFAFETACFLAGIENQASSGSGTSAGLFLATSRPEAPRSSREAASASSPEPSSPSPGIATSSSLAMEPQPSSGASTAKAIMPRSPGSDSSSPSCNTAAPGTRPSLRETSLGGVSNLRSTASQRALRAVSSASADFRASGAKVWAASKAWLTRGVSSRRSCRTTPADSGSSADSAESSTRATSSMSSGKVSSIAFEPCRSASSRSTLPTTSFAFSNSSSTLPVAVSNLSCSNCNSPSNSSEAPCRFAARTCRAKDTPASLSVWRRATRSSCTACALSSRRPPFPARTDFAVFTAFSACRSASKTMALAFSRRSSPSISLSSSGALGSSVTSCLTNAALWGMRQPRLAGMLECCAAQPCTSRPPMVGPSHQPLLSKPSRPSQ